MDKMVDQQIISRGISDPLVIETMRSVNRSLFVPEEKKIYAFEDHPLPIGYGQTISQPYIVAYMLEQLHLNQSMKVLEIGTGSGYQTALLSKIVNDVISIEVIPELAVQAGSILRINGFSNIKLIEGDGYEGYPSSAPFDAIIVSAAAPSIPDPLIQQLANNGRLIIPIGPLLGTQRLILIEKRKNKILEKNLFHVRFVPFQSDNF